MNWGTTMAERESEERMLEEMFAAARAAPEPASDALMARVLEGAWEAQGARDAAALADGPGGAAERGFFAGLWAALGGWPALGGLAAAVLAGVWIGFSPVLGVGDAMANALDGQGQVSDFVDLADGFGFTAVAGGAG